MELPPPPIHRCGLCGHAMTFERCGMAEAPDDEGNSQVRLCHADDHDCYTQWTVYGKRPDQQSEDDWVTLQDLSFLGDANYEILDEMREIKVEGRNVTITSKFKVRRVD